MSAPKSQYTIELTQQQFQFLGDIARAYDLPDESKALRCLINYAVAEPERHEYIFAEIRCMDC
jgi:hypothetical protein